MSVLTMRPGLPRWSHDDAVGLVAFDQVVRGVSFAAVVGLGMTLRSSSAIGQD